MNLDLWAEHQFDGAPGKAAPPGSIRRGYPASPRRLETVVTASLREWLLNDYVTAYCRMLRATPLYRRCYWIDAWENSARSANPSTAGDSSETGRPQRQPKKARAAHVAPPSVQYAAQLSRTLTGECPSRQFALYAIALEERAARKSSGTSDPQQLVIPKEGGIVPAGWHESAPALLAAIEQSPAIFLFNPFSRMLLTHDDLVPLYQRTNAPTELCLLLSRMHIEQWITNARENAGEAVSMTALLRSDRWRTLPTTKDGTAAASASDGIIEMLRAAIHKHMQFVQCIAVPIIRGSAVIEETPFTLLFATRRKDSLVCMNDAVCLHRRQLEEDSRRGLLSEAWFAQQQQERFAQEAQALYEETLRVGSRQRIRRWPELRQHLLLAHFGRFTLSEYDAVIRRLLQERKVTCQWRQRGQEMRDMLPGMDDVLLWT